MKAGIYNISNGVKSGARASNMELLRIVSMMMVLAVHFDGAALGLPELKGNIGNANFVDVWRLAVEALVIIGVNCFTLISGYFGIKLRIRSICNFLFECVFYSVGIYTCLSFFTPEGFSITKWIESWLVLTHTDLWYVPAYFFLMLLSPFLNAGFAALSRNKMLWVTLLFLLFNLWAGWWWEGRFNPTGYTVVQLILMYMIGGCVRKYNDQQVETPARFRNRLIVLWLGLYVAFSFLTTLYSFYNPLKAFAYNSPFVIGASVAFFLAFMVMKFQSRTINYAAKSAFAVYLIHKSPLVWGGIIKKNVESLWLHTNVVEFSVYAIIAIFAIYILCMMIDWLRRLIFALLSQNRFFMTSLN